jgi:hypothetical protein
VRGRNAEVFLKKKQKIMSSRRAQADARCIGDGK